MPILHQLGEIQAKEKTKGKGKDKGKGEAEGKPEGRGEGRSKGVRCLILTPTRELAAQVASDVRRLARYTPHRLAMAYGGTRVAGAAGVTVRETPRPVVPDTKCVRNCRRYGPRLEREGR